MEHNVLTSLDFLGLPKNTNDINFAVAVDELLTRMMVLCWPTDNDHCNHDHNGVVVDVKDNDRYTVLLVNFTKCCMIVILTHCHWTTWLSTSSSYSSSWRNFSVNLLRIYANIVVLISVLMLMFVEWPDIQNKKPQKQKSPKNFIIWYFSWMTTTSAITTTKSVQV